jgi:tetratricopeptide (TPR) repeat protein
LKTFQQARVILEKVHGPRHPDVATNLYNTGITFFRMNRYADAVPFFTQAAEQRAGFHGARHWRTAQSIGFRGQAFMGLGRDREALADLEAASAMFAEYYGPENIETLFMRAWLAQAHLLGRRYARAHEEYSAILHIAEAAEKRDASLCGLLQVGLAETSLRLDHLQEARDWLVKARTNVRPQDKRYPVLLNLEAQVHPQGMQSPEARALLKDSFEAASKQPSFPAMMLDRMRRN